MFLIVAVPHDEPVAVPVKMDVFIDVQDDQLSALLLPLVLVLIGLHNYDVPAAVAPRFVIRLKGGESMAVIFSREGVERHFEHGTDFGVRARSQ